VEIGLPQALIAQPMSNDRPKRDTMSIEEATISNLWEMTHSVPGRRESTKVLYEINDPKVRRKHGWSLAHIKAAKCSAGSCQERATHYFHDPVNGVVGFYCKPHAVSLKLS
jgi:hypothetical protein